MSQLFEPLQVPCYSCEFNSIEKVWSVAKCYYKKRTLAIQEEMNNDAFKKLVIESFQQITNTKMANLIKSNRKYITDVLK